MIRPARSDGALRVDRHFDRDSFDSGDLHFMPCPLTALIEEEVETAFPRRNNVEPARAAQIDRRELQAGSGLRSLVDDELAPLPSLTVVRVVVEAQRFVGPHI